MGEQTWLERFDAVLNGSANAPRTRSWIERLEDLDGISYERDYAQREPTISQRLHALFDEILVLREAVSVPALAIAPATLPSPPPDECDR